MRPSTLIAMLASLGLGLSACSAPAPTSWQKPGADEGTIARDTSNCRVTAQAEALRQYPQGAGSPGLGAGGIAASQQQDDANRSIVEAARFNDCMAGRGYKRG
jgi:hypothetical protein